MLFLISSKHSWGLFFGRVGVPFNKKKLSLIATQTAHGPPADKGVRGTNNSLGNPLDSPSSDPDLNTKATSWTEAAAVSWLLGVGGVVWISVDSLHTGQLVSCCSGQCHRIISAFRSQKTEQSPLRASSAPHSQRPPACAPGFSHGASCFAPAVSVICPSASAPPPRCFSLESCLQSTPRRWRILLDELTFHLGVYVPWLLSAIIIQRTLSFPFSGLYRD